MNKLKTLVVSLVLIASSGIAHAVSVSGNMAITSDYIWRGMTQNGGEVSVSGGFDLETDAGFYIGTWGGSAKFGNGESLELDYYGGYSGSIGLSYGDYEDSGTNYVIGYDIPVGDFTLSLAYTDYESDSGTADEDAFVVTLGM